MGRILAIDYGRKRCGIAVTDTAHIIAYPLETVTAAKLEQFLTEYHRKEGIEALVIGYPKTMNNEPSETVKYIEPFINRIRKVLPDIPVLLFDERYTSKMAQKTIIDGGVKMMKRREKELVDRISAAIILQSFMELPDYKSKISGK